MRYLKIGMCMLISIIAVGCGASASDLAKKDAQNMAFNLANTRMGGDVANDQLNGIDKILVDNKLKFTDIGRSKNELAEKVSADYVLDSQDRLYELRGVHKNPSRAVQLKSEIERLMRHSGKDYSVINTTSIELDRLVARNDLEDFRSNMPGPIPASMYIAAGLPVTTITRTRTIIKRVPAVTKKAPAKKPARRARRR